MKNIWEKYGREIKYAASSFASFLIDYLGTLLFTRITGILELSNVLARLISATANFFINKKIVFESDEDTFKAAIKYAVLALAVLAVDTYVLKGFVEGSAVHFNLWIAKPITEVIMFTINYFVQKLFVYKKRK